MGEREKEECEREEILRNRLYVRDSGREGKEAATFDSKIGNPAMESKVFNAKGEKRKRTKEG